MGRAANGAGTIRKKSVKRNGKTYEFWEGRVTVGTDPGTGKQIQRSITGKTQKDVAKKMQELVVEVSQGLYTAPSKLTLKDWLTIWTQSTWGTSRSPRRSFTRTMWRSTSSQSWET